MARYLIQTPLGKRQVVTRSGRFSVDGRTVTRFEAREIETGIASGGATEREAYQRLLEYLTANTDVLTGR